MSQKNRRFEPAGKKIKKPLQKSGFPHNGELGRVRTADPLIKSQMLYRLSYEPLTQHRGYV